MGNALLLQAMMAAIAKIAATEVGAQTIPIFKQQYAETLNSGPGTGHHERSCTDKSDVLTANGTC